MKRVYCLYRVSTLTQVEQNDIPMQYNACHEFVRLKGWQIIKEFYEKGISGFKKSADQREALVEIKQAAVQRKFDILLVFMFDRLGRRDDETPFIVEWFVKNGIEVWSVIEGEQRFDDHIDKLLNYIRFWHSSGESIKTSIRTRTRMEQLIKENAFVGGIPPFGYTLCKLGRINKRGRDVHDIIVEPKEASIIKTIFQLYCFENMGTYRIASYLNQQGIPPRCSDSWNSASILNILKNNTYIGIRKFGSLQTNRFPHLQIIDDATFLLAQKQIDANRIDPPHAAHSRHWSSVLLQGNLYCMHCGKRMTVTRNVKTRMRKDGTRAVYERMRYICISKNPPHPCVGQRNYSSHIVDQLVRQAINSLLFSAATVSSNSSDQSNPIHLEVTKAALAQETDTLSVLKAEVVEVIRGVSAFSPAMLTDLIQKSESKITALKKELTLIEAQVQHQKVQGYRLCELHNKLISSGNQDISILPLSEQQEIVRQLIKRIDLGKGYQHHILWTHGSEVTVPLNYSYSS